VLISFFLANAGDPDPAWPALWWIKPLLVVPVAGSFGGAFYHLMEDMRKPGLWRMVLAGFISLVGYVFTLWIGTVLGLNGTMWN
jgi:hypothetical protein